MLKRKSERPYTPLKPVSLLNPEARSTVKPTITISESLKLPNPDITNPPKPEVKTRAKLKRVKLINTKLTRALQRMQARATSRNRAAAAKLKCKKIWRRAFY